MRFSIIPVALLIVAHASCVHARQKAEETTVPKTVEGTTVPTLAAAILAPLGPLGEREVFVDAPSFQRVQDTLDGEEFGPSAIRALLNRAVRTDVASVAVVCPKGGMCHLPGDPFIISVKNSSREGSTLRFEVRYRYNQRTSRGPIMIVDGYDMTVVRLEREWQIVSMARAPH